jgi:hypothetical protein
LLSIPIKYIILLRNQPEEGMTKDRNTGGGNGLVSQRALTPEQYQALADVPSELEWLANIKNKKTKRAYEADVAE